LDEEESRLGTPIIHKSVYWPGLKRRSDLTVLSPVSLEEKHESKSEAEKLREAVMEIKEDLDELKASIDPAKFRKTSNARKSKKR